MTVADPRIALEPAFSRLDETLDRAFAGWHVPGIAYGVVLDGQLAHSGALGTLRVGEDAPPDAASVFRIASMTKSFTAATVLLLRDEGRLALDDRIDRYVPELGSLRYPSADSPPITIRHLLTMTAGFPTDDPWGDRQQGLDLDSFRRLLSGGLSFAWAPGIKFEYSNTGYGILGRLISNVVGSEYKDVVRERLLGPLGMTSTGYLHEEVEPARLAKGYLWRDGRFEDEPMDPYGALASMGGIFTTVEDLSRWVAGFIDAFPPRDDAESGHPLHRASRREMQQPNVAADLRVTQPTADAAPAVEALGYGFGLFTVDDVRLGRVVGHSGGYPGFGSNMRWHPASGIGLILLTNHRYGTGTPPKQDLLAELVQALSSRVRTIRPANPTQEARAAIEALLASWDDRGAADLFAMNVDLDEPLAARRVFIEKLADRHGALTADATEPTESHTPYHLIWWLNGSKGGRVKVEILLSPELPPKVQTFGLTSVPEPTPALRSTAEKIVAALQSSSEGRPPSIHWPEALSVGEDVDLAAIVRAMRATEARFAPISLGRPVEGDGEVKATFRLESPRGKLDLALTNDPVRDCVEAVSITPVRLVPPDLA